MKRELIYSFLLIAIIIASGACYLVFFQKGEIDYFLEQVNFDHPRRPDPMVVQIPEVPFTINKENLKVVNKKVKYGDSFYSIMRSLKLEQKKINTINRQIGKKVDLSTFHKGNPYIVYMEMSGKPLKLDYPVDDYSFLRLDFERETARVIEPPVVYHQKHIHGMIKGSLIATLDRLGAPDDLADKIITVFAWEIDFENLIVGDWFDLFFIEKSVNDKIVGTDKILAIKFSHKDEAHYAYYFESGEFDGYFDEKGQNLSRGPVKNSIVTSLFSQRRLHPVRRTYRAHKGMDFMADIGAPVMALKDGKVTIASYHYGNGNYVKIEHSKYLSTQYLHLSEIDTAIRKGVMVKAKQVIGKVGNTGLSSGPHLCLRVWYKGTQRDPLDFEFPRLDAVPADYSEEFEAYISDYFQKEL